MPKPRVVVVDLVLRWTLALWVLGTLVLLPIDLPGGLGLAIGGGLSVSVLALYRSFVRAWVRPDRWRKGRYLLIAIWLVKWPAIGALLYFGMRHWGASPAWVCLGVGLVPAVVTAVAACMALRPKWRERAVLEIG